MPNLYTKHLIINDANSKQVLISHCTSLYCFLIAADGNFNDIQPTEKKLLETKKIKEIYEIDEDDEKNVLA